MDESQDAPTIPATRRDRSVEARREARLKKYARERRIVDRLNRGVSMAELAASEGVTLRRMQILVNHLLARRQPAAPAEYVALQVNRLNEAMMVAYGAMTESNLQAVDRVVRIVGEMDRYHGFSARPNNTAPFASAGAAMEMTPEALEKARSGDGNGAGASGDARHSAAWPTR